MYVHVGRWQNYLNVRKKFFHEKENVWNLYHKFIGRCSFGESIGFKQKKINFLDGLSLNDYNY